MNRLLIDEFNRQVENLVDKGYPYIAGVTKEAFKQHLEPLRDRIKELEQLKKEPRAGYVPFVIVVQSDWINGEKAMQLVKRNDKMGFSVMDVADIKSFIPIEGIELPKGIAYLAVDIDTGKKTLNITPNEAFKTITNENRTPLTLEEGIALITHFPDILQKNNGFSLLGSRCGDRRVTALWISAGKPKLGWCWAGNPHTWLGSASCGSRSGN
ncbi:hypothetical protein QFZ77_000416 [Paenibacillus sp. V4I3]|uniref:DUF5701 family protein n=1 Tax=Paenibacillus sp. V4I3 TaxID=3042305 RepID=UPI0027884786|nr:DUF5701 family protein [Paenibacillus sp. V4I3]MDQ0871757.1 hypothetical protein [Paenibacillus sp. V4I3]